MSNTPWWWSLSHQQTSANERSNSFVTVCKVSLVKFPRKKVNNVLSWKRDKNCPSIFSSVSQLVWKGKSIGASLSKPYSCDDNGYDTPWSWNYWLGVKLMYYQINFMIRALHRVAIFRGQHIWYITYNQCKIIQLSYSIFVGCRNVSCAICLKTW